MQSNHATTGVRASQSVIFPANSHRVSGESAQVSSQDLSEHTAPSAVEQTASLTNLWNMDWSKVDHQELIRQLYLRAIDNLGAELAGEEKPVGGSEQVSMLGSSHVGAQVSQSSASVPVNETETSSVDLLVAGVDCTDDSVRLVVREQDQYRRTSGSVGSFRQTVPVHDQAGWNPSVPRNEHGVLLDDQVASLETENVVWRGQQTVMCEGKGAKFNTIGHRVLVRVPWGTTLMPDVQIVQRMPESLM